MASILDIDNPNFDRAYSSIPLDGKWALQSLREGTGDYVSVDSEDINEAQKMLAIYEGIFAEPQGATSVAGLMKLSKTGKLKKYKEIICLITNEVI